MRFLFSVNMLFLSFLIGEATLGQASENQSYKNCPHSFSLLKKGDLKKASEFLEKRKNPKCKVLEDYITWKRLLSAKNPLTYNQAASFLKTHPNWPLFKDMRSAVENLQLSHASADEIVDFFKTQEPYTLQGAKLYIQALMDKNLKKEAQKYIKKVWCETDLPTKHSKAFLISYRPYLTSSDHFRRVQFLLNEKNHSAAHDMIKDLKSIEQIYVKARIALQKNEKLADVLTREAKRHFSKDPGLVYDYVKWKMRQEHVEFIDIFTHQVRTVEKKDNPKKWSDLYQIVARYLVGVKKYEQAYAVLNGYSKEKGELQKSEFLFGVNFLKGVISYGYLKNALPEARDAFKSVLSKSSIPASTAMINYWMGKVENKMGHNVEAAVFFKKASKFPTTYYGQLSMIKLGQKISLGKVRSLKDVKGKSFKGFEDLKDLARFLHEIKHDGDQLFLAYRLLYLAKTQQEKNHFVQKLWGYWPHFGGDILRKAIGDAEGVLKESYQLRYLEHYKHSKNKHLIQAIICQESAYNRYAKSGPGAEGLMQMMPATAKSTLKKNKHLKKGNLADPAYNLKLGQIHLQEVLDDYNGNLLLTLAAYNAGGGNANKWLKAFGDPRQKEIDPDVWIESIPFRETRDYVKRVLSHKAVYERL